MNGRQQLIEQIRQQSIEKRAQALREAAQRQFSNAPIAGAVLGGGRRADTQCLPLGGVMVSVDFGDGTYSRNVLTESGTLNEQPQYLVLLGSEDPDQEFLRISWTGSQWALGQVFARNGTIDEENDFAFSPTLLSSAWLSIGPVSFATTPGEEFNCSWRHCFAISGDLIDSTYGLSATWIGIPLTEAPNAYASGGEGFSIFWDENDLAWLLLDSTGDQISILPGGTREQLPIGQFAIVDDIVLTISSGVCTFAPPLPPLPPPILPGFIFRVDTTEGNGNVSLQIPTRSALYSYDYTVNWTSVSDPSATGTVSGLTGNTTINFPSGGQYDIRITGIFPAIFFGDKFSDAAKLIRIEQWGNGVWASMQSAFGNCSNLSSYPPKDIPNLSGVSSMYRMFLNATSFNGNLSGWDVSSVTSMESMFDSASLFNGDISGWDVSHVTSMESMFNNATLFNRDLSGWCVSGIFPQPFGFDLNATAWVLPRPNWGSPCPP
jgi:surface protein